ncbi:nucleotidyl transferase AbiEii/AbiGii toxin family protein [Nocardia yamanashiensis]|uniref:nucleotidyl transferase AbiEii/AbiGii toxin family protein n=1 Tax=Nocardia yamanashiensis TaxID=209247 RepID=UPI001E2FDE8E|nr:nucleotidyl transferase AbiEii/AbiGii toxin family protein [Nocardia yamanashiensis]UGT42907.1 nucleotidyl transferase AbiEii/AbiGii toxin family protein [Nocardia yamanashiensis]
MDHLLAAVASSNWRHHLALRGSMPLKAWFGDKARAPYDLEFVVTPSRWRPHDSPAQRMCEEIPARAAELAAAGTVRIRPGPWYRPDSAQPGRDRGSAELRIAVEWECAGVGSSNLAIVFAFGEDLLTPPIDIEIPRLGRPGPPATLAAADQPLSLAWKLRKLSAPGHITGNDLFDAVLLAEHCAVSSRTLQTYVLEGDTDTRGLSAGFLAHLARRLEHVDWYDFAEEYPLLESARAEFADRLIRALSSDRSGSGGCRGAGGG